MKIKQLLAGAMLAGVTLGGVGLATAASAQTDVEPTDIVLVQEDGTTTTPESPAEAPQGEAPPTEAPEDGAMGRRGHGGGCNLSEIADLIGVDEAELDAAVEAGDTIAEVAEANGVDVEQVIDAMVAEKTDSLAEKVEEGRLTQAEADEKMADAEARITDQVNGVEAPAES